MRLKPDFVRLLKLVSEPSPHGPWLLVWCPSILHATGRISSPKTYISALPLANVFPSIPLYSAITPGEHAELEVLQLLAQQLPEAYTLFHSVEWSRGSGEAKQHGGIDIVVLNQAGNVLLIEVKAGDVEFLEGGIFKLYGGYAKDVGRQVRLQYSALRTRLQGASLKIKVHHLLVLPHMRVVSETANWPRERIVDSEEASILPARISQLLGPGVSDQALLEQVQRFSVTGSRWSRMSLHWRDASSVHDSNGSGTRDLGTSHRSTLGRDTG